MAEVECCIRHGLIFVLEISIFTSEFFHQIFDQRTSKHGIDGVEVSTVIPKGGCNFQKYWLRRKEHTLSRVTALLWKSSSSMRGAVLLVVYVVLCSHVAYCLFWLHFVSTKHLVYDALINSVLAK